MKYKYLITVAVLTVFVMLIPDLLHAQLHMPFEGPSTFGAPTFGPNDVADAPIDGGLSLLVAAGVGYGTKHIKERRKKQGK